MKKAFSISELTREDLDDAGFDATSVTDKQMEDIASDLNNAYREQVFYIDLPIIAEDHGVPEKAENNPDLLK